MLRAAGVAVKRRRASALPAYCGRTTTTWPLVAPRSRSPRWPEGGRVEPPAWRQVLALGRGRQHDGGAALSPACGRPRPAAPRRERTTHTRRSLPRRSGRRRSRPARRPLPRFRAVPGRAASTPPPSPEASVRAAVTTSRDTPRSVPLLVSATASTRPSEHLRFFAQLPHELGGRVRPLAHDLSCLRRGRLGEGQQLQGSSRPPQPPSPRAASAWRS